MQADGWVVGAAGQPLAFCDGIKTSLPPPPCGGPTLQGTSDDQVPGLSTYAGVRFTNNRVSVTADWDGTALTPIGAIAPTPVPAFTRPDWPVPCPAPEGGWHRDPVSTTDPGAVQTLVAGDPEFGGLWVTYPGQPPDRKAPDPAGQVTVVAFTGHLADHQALIEKSFDGLLCITTARYSNQHLLDVMNDFSLHPERLRAAGISSVSGGPDAVHNRLDLRVTLADRATVVWFAANYPPDMITVEGWLRPVP